MGFVGCLTLSVCVCGNAKKLCQKLDDFGVLLFDLAKNGHGKLPEMFILEKTLYCDFLPFKRLEVFHLHQNFVSYLS